MSVRPGYLSRKQRLIVFFSILFLSTPIWVRLLYLDLFRIPSASMQPTLQINDLIVANKMQYGLRLPLGDHYLRMWDKPKRNQVILFRYPPDPKTIYIKRVIGLPGDQLKMDTGRIFINGQEVDARISYATSLNKTEIIPPDQYFVMGDNREHSSDSRVWGYVPLQNVIAMAEMVLININNPDRMFQGIY